MENKTPNGEKDPANAEGNAGDEGNQDGGEGGSNDRLLSESKKFKARALQAEKELADLKKKANEEQGNFKALYEDLHKKHQGLQGQVVKEKISSAVSKEAVKAGCIDPDALLKLGNRELLQYDEESFAVYGADSFVEDAKKQFAYLFKSENKSAINPLTPGTKIGDVKKVTVAEISKLSAQDRNAVWAKALQKR